jgi:predicted RNA-binding protein YlxR (DUF448 family)
MALPTPATETDTGPRMPGRERLCAATREVRPIEGLIRFVAGPQGLVPDLKRKLPGRGVWVTARRETVAEAVKRGTFKQSLKSDVAVPADLPAMVDRLMVRSALDALAMAHKAGQIVAGTGKVEDAIAGDRAVAIIHASEAAPDGVRKLAAALKRQSPGDNGDETGGKMPVIRAFTSAELDLALGRSNVVHAALLAGRAGETFLMRWQDLRHFRLPGREPDYRVDDAGLPNAAAQKLEME